MFKTQKVTYFTYNIHFKIVEGMTKMFQELLICHTTLNDYIKNKKALL